MLSILAFELVPEELDVRTDIVGYPTYANFNINRYFWAYGLTVVLFPLLVFGIYVALTRIFARSNGPRGPVLPPLEQVEEVPPVRAMAGAPRRRLGAPFLSVAFSVSRRRSSSGALEPPALIAASMLGYGARGTRWCLGRLAGRRAASCSDVVAPREHGRGRASHGGACCTACRSRRRSRSRRPVRCINYPWLPLWLARSVDRRRPGAWLVRGLLGAATLDRASSAHRAPGRGPGGRDPSALFLLVALPTGRARNHQPVRGGPDPRGERSSRVTAAFPWRRCPGGARACSHDVGTGLVRLGGDRGQPLGCCGRGAAAHRAALVGRAVLPVRLPLRGRTGCSSSGHSCSSSRARSSRIHYRPRAHPARPPAAGGAPPPSDRRASVSPSRRSSSCRRSSRPKRCGRCRRTCSSSCSSSSTTATDGRAARRRAFRRTWLVARERRRCSRPAGPTFPAGRTARWTTSFSATRAFVPGHQLTGGAAAREPTAPLLQPGNVGERYEEIANSRAGPPRSCVAMFFFVARTRARAGRSSIQDWVMLAAIAFVASVLRRSSSAGPITCYHSFAMAVPGASLRGLPRRDVRGGDGSRSSAQERGARRGSRCATRSRLPLLLVLLASAPVALADVFRDVPRHFAAEVTREPDLDRLGYARKGENIQMFRDVDRALDSLLEPGEAVFDSRTRPGTLPLPGRSAGEQPLLPHQHRDSAAESDRSHSAAREGSAQGHRVLGRGPRRVAVDLGQGGEPGASLRRERVPAGSLRARARITHLRVDAPSRRCRSYEAGAVLPRSCMRLGNIRRTSSNRRLRRCRSAGGCRSAPSIACCGSAGGQPTRPRSAARRRFWSAVTGRSLPEYDPTSVAQTWRMS